MRLYKLAYGASMQQQQQQKTLTLDCRLNVDKVVGANVLCRRALYYLEISKRRKLNREVL